MKIPTITLPEDLIQLRAELTIMAAKASFIADRCDHLLQTMLKFENDQTEMFDTGEPTSAYVDQDR